MFESIIINIFRKSPQANASEPGREFPDYRQHPEGKHAFGGRAENDRVEQDEPQQSRLPQEAAGSAKQL